MLAVLVMVAILPAHGPSKEYFASGAPFATWGFILELIGEGTTRLMARCRADYAPTLVGKLANHYLLEPIHFIMERCILLGIKEWAELMATVDAPQPLMEGDGNYRAVAASCDDIKGGGG